MTHDTDETKHYPQRYIGQFTSFNPDKWGASYTIKEVRRGSARKIALDLVEPNGAQATLTFESQDGSQFIGLYKRKDGGGTERIHMNAVQYDDGEELVLVMSRPEPDGLDPMGMAELILDSPA